MEELEIHEKKTKVELNFQGIIDDTFSKRLLYSIKTVENQAEYNKFRSSQDFLHLRSQMLKKWVSFLIPSIPKLTFSILKPLSDLKIKQKSKFLLEFLQKCITTPEIFSCSDLQLFLKGPENYIENSKQIKIDYKEIYTKLSYREKDLPEVTIDYNSIISQAQHLKTCLAELLTMKRKMKDLSEVFTNMQINQKTTFKLFERVQQNYLDQLEDCNKIELDQFGTEKNPYNEILDWATRECYNVKSILEEIEKFSELFRLIEKTEKRIEKKRDVVKTLENGRRPISVLFNAKPKDQIISMSNSDLVDMDSEFNALNKLLVLLYLHLTTKTFPDENKKLLDKYQECMESFSHMIISTFSTPIS